MPIMAYGGWQPTNFVENEAQLHIRSVPRGQPRGIEEIQQHMTRIQVVEAAYEEMEVDMDHMVPNQARYMPPHMTDRPRPDNICRTIHGLSLGPPDPTLKQTEPSCDRNRGERQHPSPTPLGARDMMDLMDTPMVRAVLNMDIPEGLVRRAIVHRGKDTGVNFPSAEALTDAALNLSDSHQGTAARLAGSGEPSPINTAPCSLIEKNHQLREEKHLLTEENRQLTEENRQLTEENRQLTENCQLIEKNYQQVIEENCQQLIEENRKLKEERTCKVCMDKERCTFFVPCGHLLCCSTCATAVIECPICRSPKQGIVQVFMP